MFELFAHTNDVVDEGLFGHMTDNTNGGGFAVFWMFIMMVVVVVGVIYLLMHLGNENNQSKNEDPLAVAKLRLAKGEIDKKQFDEIKKLVN